MSNQKKSIRKGFFLFYDISDEDAYSEDILPYRSAGTELEACRLSENWDGPDGLWFECELDENDNPINMRPRPDIKLIRRETRSNDIFIFREGDIVNGAGPHLGTYDWLHIQEALNDLRAYFTCVYFEHEEVFIKDSELITLINSSKTLIITTNNNYTIYIEHCELNRPAFDRIS